MRLLFKKEGVGSIINEGVPAQRNRTAEWVKDDTNCACLIVSHLHNDILNMVSTHNHGRDIWMAIKTNYQRPSNQRIVELRELLSNMRFTQGENIRDYIMRHRAIVNELGSLNCGITATQHMIQLLKQLPIQFLTLRTNIETSTGTPSWDVWVVESLMWTRQ